MKYYIVVNKERKGPYSIEQLKDDDIENNLNHIDQEDSNHLYNRMKNQYLEVLMIYKN